MEVVFLCTVYCFLRELYFLYKTNCLLLYLYCIVFLCIIYCFGRDLTHCRLLHFLVYTCTVSSAFYEFHPVHLTKHNSPQKTKYSHCKYKRNIEARSRNHFCPEKATSFTQWPYRTANLQTLHFKYLFNKYPY
jgi:hypothetical protein